MWRFIRVYICIHVCILCPPQSLAFSFTFICSWVFLFLSPAKKGRYVFLVCYPFLCTCLHLPTLHTLCLHMYTCISFSSLLGWAFLGVIYSWVFFSLCRAKRGFCGVEGYVFLYICIQRGFCFLGVSFS